MQVVMAAAGKGSRFKDYTEVPKPFINIDGKPMWWLAMEQWLDYGIPTVLFHTDHERWYEDPPFDVNIIWLDEYTQGAAHTAYLGLKMNNLIDGGDGVVFVECDSNIHFDHSDWLKTAALYSGTFTTHSTSPNHSYCRVEGLKVLEIREKEVISQYANTGHYWWRTANEFMWTFEDAYENNRRTRGEFYMAPLYNDLIRSGKSVAMHMVDQWDCWGTPAELEKFIESSVDY